MADKTRELQIVLSAKDNASGTFSRVGKAMDEMNGKSEKGALFGLGGLARDANLSARRSGEAAIEKLLKGGGALGLATFGAEELKRLGDSLREVSVRFLEGETAAGGYFQKIGEGLPLIGRFVTAGESIGKAIQDFRAARAKAAGASDSEVESLMSDESHEKLMQHRQEILDVIDKSTRGALKGARLSKLDHFAKERAEVEEAFKDEMSHLTSERSKIDQLADYQQPGAHKQIAVAETAAREERAQKLHTIDLRENQEEQQLTEEHVRRVHDIVGEAGEMRLRQSRDFFAADKAAIQRHYGDLEAAAAKAAQARINAEPKNRELREREARRFAETRDALHRQREAAVAEAAEVNIERQNHLFNHHIDTKVRLMTERANLLEKYGVFANPASQAEGERIALHASYLNKAKELNQIVQDRDTTEKEKNAARMAIELLPLQEKIDLKQLGVGVATAHIAPTDSSRFLRDLPAAKLEQYSRDQLNTLKEMRDLSKQLLDEIKNSPSVSYGGD